MEPSQVVNVVYKKVCDFFNQYSSCQVGILGGAVRDIYLKKKPKDIDIFVICNDDDIALIKKAAFDFRNGGESPFANIFQQSTIANKNNSLNENYGHPFQEKWPILSDVFIKDESVSAENQIPCQLMVRNKSKFSNFFELINDFDWNICKYGLFDSKLFDLNDYGFDLVYTRKNTGLERLSDLIYSLKRGFYFSEKYKINLSQEEIIKISSFVVNNKFAKNNIFQHKTSLWQHIDKISFEPF
jgi:hypothetical protein